MYSISITLQVSVALTSLGGKVTNLQHFILSLSIVTMTQYVVNTHTR